MQVTVREKYTMSEKDPGDRQRRQITAGLRRYVTGLGKWMRSKHDTTCTAATVTIILSVTRVTTITTWAASADASWGGGSAGRLLLVVFPYLPNEVAECLIDVDTLLGGSFDELAAKVLGQVSSLVHPNLTLIFEIALVGNNNDGEGVNVLDSEDLLVESADFLERVAGCDGVDEQEPFACAHVLLTHRSVFFLPSGIQYVQQCDLLIDHALLAVRVLNSRIILVDEVALNELNRQSRLPNTTSSDHH